MTDGLTLNLFAGPGGWCTGARKAGLRGDMVGIEWDGAACATARAAGHHRIQADVSRLDPLQFNGIVRRMIGSPPCPTFSMAGDGGGRLLLGALAAAMTRMGRGRKVMAATRRECTRILRAVAASHPKYRAKPRADRTRWAAEQARMSVLVLEPLRWTLALRPEWIALEQVPAVLPLWQHMAAILAEQGYRTWTGVLSAEEYGVPQTRKRAILTASRVGPARRPEPTHQPYRAGRPAATEPDLFGDPLPPPVSMADALGWGLPERPAWTVTGGGTATGGAEVFGSASNRAALRDIVQKRDRGTGMAERHGARPDRSLTEPSFAITSGIGGAGARLGWALRNGNQRNACIRSLTEPAGTLFFGNRTNAVDWVMPRMHPAGVHGSYGYSRAVDEPSPTIKGGGSGGQYVSDGVQTVRVTVIEAGVLQSFPADYPWQGTKSEQYRQVGDAVPPDLAAAIVSALEASVVERAA